MRLGCERRYGKYKALKRNICDAEGSLENFAEGYNKFGVRRGMQDGKVGCAFAADFGRGLADFGRAWNHALRGR